MKTILFFASSLILFCCATSKKMNQKKDNTSKNLKNTEIKTAILGDINQSSLSTKIHDVSLNDNVLRLSIGYTGGCAKHNFELVGSEMISKSLPPIRSIKLIHTTIKEDACKKEIFDTLYFDLSNLAYQKINGSVIKLNLDGYKDQIIYTFK